MKRLLNSSKLIGLLIESDKAPTRACCPELVSPGAAFHVLRYRHQLCPTDLSNPHKPRPLLLETLCSLPRQPAHAHVTRDQQSFWPNQIYFEPCGARDESEAL